MGGWGCATSDGDIRVCAAVTQGREGWMRDEGAWVSPVQASQVLQPARKKCGEGNVLGGDLVGIFRSGDAGG